MRSKIVVIVEGLIGSGKSTFCKQLAKDLGKGTLLLLEPDEEANANPYLADYYGSPERWSFTMQCHLLSARYRMHQHAQWHSMQGYGHSVLDRSYFGDTAFANLQLSSGLMSPREFETYRSLYQAMTASVLHPQVCVYLDVTTDTAQRRISRRMTEKTGRQCESVIDRGYLNSLRNEIEGMLEVLERCGVHVIRMPWNEDSPSVREDLISGLAKKLLTKTPPSLLELHGRSL